MIVGAQEDQPFQSLSLNEPSHRGAYIPISSVEISAAENGRPTPRRTLGRSGTLLQRVNTLRLAPQKTPALPLIQLLPTLTPLQARFFEYLDSELDKIEAFYVEREKEAKARYVFRHDCNTPLRPPQVHFSEATTR